MQIGNIAEFHQTDDFGNLAESVKSRLSFHPANLPIGKNLKAR
jgi:hypothetical protein